MNKQQMLTIIGALVVVIALVTSAAFVLTGDNNNNLEPDEKGVIHSGSNITAQDLDVIKNNAKQDSNVTLEVTSGNSTVVFSNSAISTLTAAKLDISQVPASSLSNRELVITEGQPVYSFDFGDNTEFGENGATVTVPYTLSAGEDPNNLLIYYMSNEQILETKEAAYADGKVTFKTSHFSTYVIGTKTGYEDYLAGLSTYSFYISNGDSELTGWYSAKALDAAQGFSLAMEAAGLTYTINTSGYVSEIGGIEGFWYSAMYLYNNTSKAAADASILYPVTSYGSYNSSNGWTTIYGYDETGYSGDKIIEMNGYAYFFSLYDATTYAHTDPTTDKGWMTTGPFETEITLGPATNSYNFYIQAGDSYLTGWYSAEGKNAAEAFKAAMDKAGIDFTINASGYLAKIGDLDGMWYEAAYLYSSYTSNAANGSIKCPVTNYGSYNSSNGWITIYGYDIQGYTGDKLCEFISPTYYFSMYDLETYAHPDPTTDATWMTTGPFGDNDLYHFYVSAGDSTITGWYSGAGKNAAEAFKAAMETAGIDYTINASGYLSKIGDIEASWYSAMYLYNNTSKAAADASILYPVTNYGSYNSSNGWTTIYGYDMEGYTGDKIIEMDGHVFFFAPYDPTTYAHKDPTSDKAWMTTGPFASETKLDDDTQTYYFYVDADSLFDGWYSAEGKNAAEAFKAAMDKAGIDFTINASGYLSKIGDKDGMWYEAAYLYAATDSTAASNSVLYTVKTSYGSFNSSNGWISIYGYDIKDYTGDKLCEFESNVYYFSMYDMETYAHTDPTTSTDWMDEGPFGDGDSVAYFYISAGENELTGWYSGSGSNPAAAFANAMDKAGIDYQFNASGYLSKIGDIEASWYSAMYLYNNTSDEAMKASIQYPVSTSYGFNSSNGWISIYGYDKEGYHGDKLVEMTGYAYFFSPYDPTTYTHTDPTTDTNWMDEGPFEDEIMLDDGGEYTFYIDVDNYELAGWYYAEGENAAEAFAAAMEKAGIDYEINSSGYLAKIGDKEGMWFEAAYLYLSYEDDALTASTKYPVNNSYGYFSSSNGWVAVNAYNIPGYSGDKLCVFNSHTYYFSMYDMETYACKNPSADTEWIDAAKGESYYFYINAGEDNNLTGWYAGRGDNAATGFDNAMDLAGIEYSLGSSGYLSKIGDVEGFWYSAMYLYNNTTDEAMKASILYPVSTSYGFNSSNGWITIYGYDMEGYSGDKLLEMDGHIFYFSLYDPTTYTHDDPTSDEGWKDEGPFEDEASLVKPNETYSFYINTADDSGLTGWYYAEGTDAADAFGKAMTKAEIPYEINASGYLAKIGDFEGSWYIAAYLYTKTNLIAEGASVCEPVENHGSYNSSNGWTTIYGYDVEGYTGFKLSQFEANVYYITPYLLPDYSHADPTTDYGWFAEE